MKFLITAGPTREPIDPVRFLSNRSSGKMGYAIAQAAINAGHQVVLISGPVAIPAPQGVELVNVTTSDEMFEAVHSHLADIDVAVLCAAVADFKPAEVATRKIKKHEGTPHISLVPTRDILASLGKIAPRKFLLAGFAAETNDVAANAQKKLREKGCDVVIANDVSIAGLGFESDDNALTLFFPDQSSRVLPRASKQMLAVELVKIFHDLKEIY
jgi:phosphopantothenoylcysteine decarboxylase/phosphopantothenate--cysteine ligase